MKRADLKQALWDILLALDVPTKEITEPNIDRIVDNYLPKKVKKPKVVEHTYLGRIILTEEEDLNEFLEEKEDWLADCSMPSFSFDKGESPDAVEGEEMFVRINNDLYAFTIHEGECVEASWSGSIYRTEVRNVRLIPEEECENYNLVKIKGWQWGYDY